MKIKMIAVALSFGLSCGVGAAAVPDPESSPFGDTWTSPAPAIHAAAQAQTIK